MPIWGLPFAADEIFPVTNLVFPVWALMAILPHSKVTNAVVKLTALLFSLLYVLLFAKLLSKEDSEFSFADFGSMAGLLKMFKQPDAVLAGWVHYIAIDLWAGYWIATDGVKRRIPRIIMAPVLFFSMMVGPAGLLLHFVISSFWKIKIKTE